MAEKQNVSDEEAAVRDLIEAWADSVRRKDYAGILRSHTADFVMFDVPPPFKDTTVPMLQQLAEASRKDAGNKRFEALQQANRPNHFTVVEAWADRKAYESHVLADHTRQFRDKLGPMSGALYDERLFKAVN